MNSKSYVSCPYCGQEYSNKGIGTHIWRNHGAGINFNPNKNKHVAWNKGLTKLSDVRVLNQAKKITKTKHEYQKEVDDDGKMYQRYSNKRINARREGIGFNLTFEEFCILCKEKHLKSSNLGFSGDGFVLARYNDKGDYSYGNCRFVTNLENIHERDEHLTFTNVKCIEDNKYFDSITHAANYYKIHRTTLSDALKLRKGYVKTINKTFEKIE